MNDIPCKQCIGLAICISKRHIDCDILWSYYKIGEYETSELITFNKICKILPNMGSLRGPEYTVAHGKGDEHEYTKTP